MSNTEYGILENLHPADHIGSIRLALPTPHGFTLVDHEPIDQFIDRIVHGPKQRDI